MHPRLAPGIQPSCRRPCPIQTTPPPTLTPAHELFGPTRTSQNSARIVRSAVHKDVQISRVSGRPPVCRLSISVASKVQYCSLPVQIRELCQLGEFHYICTYS